MNDVDLVHASKTGDVDAFEELVKRYHRKLLASRNTSRTTEKTPRTQAKRPF
jgi:hypothetical protein